MFRLLNEETNQTIDDSSISDSHKNKVKGMTIDLEEGEGQEEEEEPQDEEDEEGEEEEEKPEKVILVGRLFKEEGEWIYEKFNYAYMEEDFPDLVTKLAEMEP